MDSGHYEFSSCLTFPAAGAVQVNTEKNTCMWSSCSQWKVTAAHFQHDKLSKSVSTSRWFMRKWKTNPRQQPPSSGSQRIKSLQSWNTELWLSLDQWQYQMNSTWYSFINMQQDRDKIVENNLYSKDHKVVNPCVPSCFIHYQDLSDLKGMVWHFPTRVSAS